MDSELQPFSPFKSALAARGTGSNTSTPSSRSVKQAWRPSGRASTTETFQEELDRASDLQLYISRQGGGVPCACLLQREHRFAWMTAQMLQAQISLNMVVFCCTRQHVALALQTHSHLHAICIGCSHTATSGMEQRLFCLQASYLVAAQSVVTKKTGMAFALQQRSAYHQAASCCMRWKTLHQVHTATCTLAQRTWHGRPNQHASLVRCCSML